MTDTRQRLEECHRQVGSVIGRLNLMLTKRTLKPKFLLEDAESLRHTADEMEKLAREHTK